MPATNVGGVRCIADGALTRRWGSRVIRAALLLNRGG